MGSQAAASVRPGLRRDDSFISIGSFYGEPQIASEQDTIPLPPFHWELLEGGAAPSNRPGGSRERQKVILLHGWHQARSCCTAPNAGPVHDEPSVAFLADIPSSA